MKPLCFSRMRLQFALPLLVLLTAQSGCHPKSGGGASSTPGAPTPNAPTAQAKPAGPPPLPAVPPEGVRGIYLTGWSAGSPTRFPKLVGLVDRTDLNAMVIDVKDDGEVYYNVDVPLAKESKALNHSYKVDPVIATLNEHHIFPIARIACMRDKPLALAHPELAVHDASGKVWRDHSGHYWLNPYKKEVWDYNVDIALDALKHGFKDIQFDYVRFPSEGKLNTLRFDGKPEGAKREDQIEAFMKYAADKIHAHGGWFSADVFGLTSMVKNDEGIGQKFEKITKNPDYLCPMVYPSHYAFGEYHLKDPNKEPYKTITLSVGDAQKRMPPDTKCKLRPWIQDFDLRGVYYKPKDVRAEIKALEDLNIHEFLIWNAKNQYIERHTEEALKKAPNPMTGAPSTPPAAAPKTATTPTGSAKP